MTYFAPGYTCAAAEPPISMRLLEQADESMTRAQSTWDRLGLDPRDYGLKRSQDVRDEIRQQRDEARRRSEEAEDVARQTLAEIRQQAVSDAEEAWNAGEGFFAPVLAQPLRREGSGWEGALRDITAIGWRLDSWQVIGPAPEPFGSAVTLIQTLFVR